MVNEWLNRAEKLRPEPFDERMVIDLPCCGLIQSPNLARVDKTGSLARIIWRNFVDRRSFMMSLFGGLAAAGLGGTAIAQAATRKPGLAPAMPASGGLDAATKAALDQADADFNQVVIRERTVVRRPRPVVHRRPVVVRERVVVRRPRPLPRRRVVVRRRVIVR
jgi:hypothetical protein